MKTTLIAQAPTNYKIREQCRNLFARLTLLFCRHKNHQRMTEGDFAPWTKPNDTYIFTSCPDCGTITHGRWMGQNETSGE
jgi:hypothetical protein